MITNWPASGAIIVLAMIAFLAMVAAGLAKQAARACHQTYDLIQAPSEGTIP